MRALLALVVCVALTETVHADAGVPDAGAGVDGGAVDGGPDATSAAPERRPEPPPGHEPLVVSERTPSGDVHVGDLVTWTVRATILESDDLQIPQQRFRALEIRRKTVSREAAVDGKRTVVIRIELVAFEAGDHTVGPLRLMVLTDDGQLGETEVAGIRVRVRSLLGNEPNAQPKPATPPLTLMEEDPTLKYVGYALLAMLAGGIVAFRIALRRLEELAGQRSARIEAGESALWVDELSDTIRAYLGAQYGFDGLDCTTDEIAAHLRGAFLGALSWQDVITFLGECDLTKFAAILPSDERTVALHETALRIVHLTLTAVPQSVRVSAPPAGRA
jgi:hypothetical protein